MSDEADRIKAYQDLARRGQPVPGKNFGTGVTPKINKTPKIKIRDTTKLKQIKLLKVGGATDPLKNIAKVIQTVGSGKTGIKTIDRQKKKDAILTKNLKKLGKTTKVKSKPQKLNIRSDSKSPFSIQKQTIMMAGGGEVVNMTKSTMINPETGE